ncbi:MAG TPA: hypothetical protein VF995_01755 [Actinomycetota bacterium]
MVLVWLIVAVTASILLVFVAGAPSGSQTIELIAVAAVVIGGLRYLSLRRLRLQAFMHVRETIKADNLEAYVHQRQALRGAIRSARRERRLVARSTRLGTFYPPIASRPADPGNYVKLRLGGIASPWVRVQDVRGMIIRWTPFVRSPNEAFLTELTEGVAHFWGVDPTVPIRSNLNLTAKSVQFRLP